jgi:hypothetical protein
VENRRTESARFEPPEGPLLPHGRAVPTFRIDRESCLAPMRLCSTLSASGPPSERIVAYFARSRASLWDAPSRLPALAATSAGAKPRCGCAGADIKIASCSPPCARISPRRQWQGNRPPRWPRHVRTQPPAGGPQAGSGRCTRYVAITTSLTGMTGQTGFGRGQLADGQSRRPAAVLPWLSNDRYP